MKNQAKGPAALVVGGENAGAQGDAKSVYAQTNGQQNGNQINSGDDGCPRFLPALAGQFPHVFQRLYQRKAVHAKALQIGKFIILCWYTGDKWRLSGNFEAVVTNA